MYHRVVRFFEYGFTFAVECESVTVRRAVYAHFFACRHYCLLVVGNVNCSGYGKRSGGFPPIVVFCVDVHNSRPLRGHIVRVFTLRQFIGGHKRKEAHVQAARHTVTRLSVYFVELRIISIRCAGSKLVTVDRHFSAVRLFEYEQRAHTVAARTEHARAISVDVVYAIHLIAHFVRKDQIAFFRAAVVRIVQIWNKVLNELAVIRTEYVFQEVVVLSLGNINLRYYVI